MSDKVAPTDAPKKKRGKKWLFLTGVLLVMLGGGSGGAYWWMSQQPAGKPGAKASHEEGETAEESGDRTYTEADLAAAKKKRSRLEARDLLVFEPFVVNLADRDGSRFVKTTISLAVTEAKLNKKLEEEPVVKSRLRSTILELLAQQTASQITTQNGKDALKERIARRTERILRGPKVAEVLITDLIVQF